VMMQGGQIVEPLGASTLPHSVKPASSLPPEIADLPTDVDLDLDLDLDAPTVSELPLTANEMTRPLSTSALAPEEDDNAMAFELPDEAPRAEFDDALTQPPVPDALDDGNGLDFDLGDLDSAAPATDAELPDFDVSTPSALGPDSAYGDLNADPLGRKLELAEEFRQIGDLEGARDLLEEVIAKADGALKTKAQGMLDRLA
jgi:pilus assembly protein FimV